MTRPLTVPAVSVSYQQTGAATACNELGMRTMQERAFERRGEQYLLIKSPPASGKSRTLMFLALDKLHRQGLRKAIVTVPEKSIGASFADEPLSALGFWADWTVRPRWNLCNAPGGEEGKAADLGKFLESTDPILVCPHATFRNAVDRFGVAAFDACLIAIDEFHHASANPDNKLGAQLAELMDRDKVHLVAMTGSYFRGDAEAILSPENEAKFATVTYTYYEQLNGYEHLKQLDIGYFFYSGAYADSILQVLNSNEKTIVHIPSVNARESTKDKVREVEHIIDALGEWQYEDPDTGFQLVKTGEGRTLRIADLVNDDPAKRPRVLTALNDPTQKQNRDQVDLIIALGMAKEGFDWIWCEHALTVGYRASLTEVVQIIGRTIRDAPGKARARFTNLIAEPEAAEQKVTEAVNDTLKAIAASLLMEQVLIPKFEFAPKVTGGGPRPGFDYGAGGYDPARTNVSFNEDQGTVLLEVKGLKTPKTPEAERICQEDLTDLVATFVQNRDAMGSGLFNEDTIPEELTVVTMGKIVADRHPNLDDEDQEAVRQRAIAALTLPQQAKQAATEQASAGAQTGSSAFVEGVRKFAMDVRELDIDLIDSINPFGPAYSILSKTMSEERLKQVAAIIAAKKVQMTPDEARMLADRAVQFKKEHGRLPALTAANPWEVKMAEGVAFLTRMVENASPDDRARIT